MSSLISNILIISCFCVICLTSCVSNKPNLYDNDTFNNKSQYESFIEDNAPNRDAFVAVQRLAASFISNKNLDEAREIFEKYYHLFPNMSDEFDSIINILKERPTNQEVINLGDGVNSELIEHTPVLSADGKSLFFTRYKEQVNDNEDIYIAEKGVNNKWLKAKIVTNPISTLQNESVMSVSVDGNTLILFGHYPGEVGGGDLYFSEKVNKGWSKPIPFPNTINSENFECSGTLTPDGKALIFISDKPGGNGPFIRKDKELYNGSYWGNTDIYISFKDGDTWGRAINLGNVINTPYAEQSPFIHPDGKTLYFSSEGHPGLGKLDVFKSVRLSEDSWTDWSVPENLGVNINSSSDDWGYKISTDGSIAVLSTIIEDNNFGKSDIYSIKLIEKQQPDKVVTVQGRVVDQKGETLSAEIIWEDLATQKELGQLKSSPSDGSFFIVLPLGKKYGLRASKTDYYSVSEEIDLKKVTDSENLHLDIELVSISKMKEENIVLKNIFFDYNKAVLLPESYPELNRLTEFLESHPSTKIDIKGHTDNQGSIEYNLELSALRAKSVADYLTTNGIDAQRIKYSGYGESKPIADNAKEDGRKINRRVEFTIVD